MKHDIKRKLFIAFLFSPAIGLVVRMPGAAVGAQAMRLIEAYDPRMEGVADGVLAFILKRSGTRDLASAILPRQTCLRGVKKGMLAGGIFKRYPAWPVAAQMTKILNDTEKTKKFVKSNFRFIQLTYVKDVSMAPAYSVLIYGGDAHGHIEVKIPAAHLIARGFTYAYKSVKGKEVKVPLSQLDYVYVSDYIDAYPRNHPNSRIASNKPDNRRPLKAVFELREIQEPKVPILQALTVKSAGKLLARGN